MLITDKRPLEDFALDHADSRSAINSWIALVENASWRTKQDVKKTFPRAKLLKGNRARFELVHNRYRLIVLIEYIDQYVDVLFIGTHNDYEKLDPSSL